MNEDNIRTVRMRRFTVRPDREQTVMRSTVARSPQVWRDADRLAAFWILGFFLGVVWSGVMLLLGPWWLT